MNFTLELLPNIFAICRLEAEAHIPDWAQGEFVSITRTKDELSVVCRQENVPHDVHNEERWRCLRLAGQFDLSEVDVLASLTNTLAEEKVSPIAL